LPAFSVTIARPSGKNAIPHGDESPLAKVVSFGGGNAVRCCASALPTTTVKREMHNPRTIVDDNITHAFL
jgi:hypothetical protein